MNNNTVMRARIVARTTKEAAAVLGAMGLTLSDAFRLLVRRIAADKALPFERLVPNEKTTAAMRGSPRRRAACRCRGADGTATAVRMGLAARASGRSRVGNCGTSAFGTGSRSRSGVGF